MTVDAEEALIRAFVLRAKQDRYLSFLAKPKLRNKFLRQLYHFRDFDPRCVVQVPAAQQTASGIGRELMRRGAPHVCYVVSTNRDLDQRTLPLSDVLEEIVGADDGTLLSCVHGKLAYFEGEPPNFRFILHSDLRRSGG